MDGNGVSWGERGGGEGGQYHEERGEIRIETASQSLWRVPLSARGELQSRTRWLNKLRPAGASLMAEGPEGPIAPVVTTGSYLKKTWNMVLPCHLPARQWRTYPEPMKQISADLLAHANHDAWRLEPADRRREK